MKSKLFTTLALFTLLSTDAFADNRPGFDAFEAMYKEKFGASVTRQEIEETYDRVSASLKEMNHEAVDLEEIRLSIISGGVKSEGRELLAAVGGGIALGVGAEAGLGYHTHNLGSRPHLRIGGGLGLGYGATGSLLISNWDSKRSDIISPPHAHGEYGSIAYVIGVIGADDMKSKDSKTSMSRAGLSVGGIGFATEDIFGFGIPLLVTIPTRAGSAYLKAKYLQDKILQSLRNFNLTNLQSDIGSFKAEMERLDSRLGNRFVKRQALEELPAGHPFSSMSTLYSRHITVPKHPFLRSCARMVGFIFTGK